jgi:hypothetical protein
LRYCACQDLEISRSLARNPKIPSQRPRASLTNVVALNGGPGSPEAQTDVLHPSPATLSSPLGLAALLLVVLEDVRLLLESALALDSEFGGHDRYVLGNRSKLATMVYFSEVVVEVAVGGSSVQRAPSQNSPSCVAPSRSHSGVPAH